MRTEFVKPRFDEKSSLELRFEDGEVRVYGTRDGLKRLATLCMELTEQLKGDSPEHIHLEDRELLTTKSLKGVIAVFFSD